MNRSIAKDEEEKIHGAMRELVEQRLGDLAKVKTALVVSESPAKGIGVCWKQSSVSLEPIGCGEHCRLLARLQT